MTPGTTRDTTPDATQGDSRGDVSRDTATVTEAAKRLRVTVRTVQRRLDRGELKSIEADGKRLVVLPVEATAGATGDATPDTTRRDSDTRHDVTGDTTSGEAIARLLDEKDARIADLRATVDAQRLQIEAANRTAAETAAAMRDLVKLQAKALPAPGDEGAPQAPQHAGIPAAVNRTQLTQSGQQRPAARKTSALWRRWFGR